eukprot:916464-Rhodomonas_salina.3
MWRIWLEAVASGTGLYCGRVVRKPKDQALKLMLDNEYPGEGRISQRYARAVLDGSYSDPSERRMEQIEGSSSIYASSASRNVFWGVSGFFKNSVAFEVHRRLDRIPKLKQG